MKIILSGILGLLLSACSHTSAISPAVIDAGKILCASFGGLAWQKSDFISGTWEKGLWEIDAQCVNGQRIQHQLTIES